MGKSILAAFYSFIILTVMLLFAGCGSTVSSSVTLAPSPVSTGQLLTQAGFKMRPANTPQKAAHLNTLPQQQIIPLMRQGQMRYLYADAASCNCMYIGDQAAYQRYQSLAAQRTDVYNPVSAPGPSLSVPTMDWGLWEEMQGAP